MTTPIFRHLSVVSDSGSGRPFILLHERDHVGALCESLTVSLTSRTRVVSVQTDRVTDKNYESLVSELHSLLNYNGIRQASFVAFGACGATVQALALQELKLVRTVAFVDASTRAHPSYFTRLVDRLEHALPLGLPLRLHEQGFDAKPFLQRIRCPVLVITSSKASAYERSEAAVLEAGLPTAWRVELEAAGEAEKLATLVLEFQEVPAKCPRKGGGAATLA